MVAQKALRVVNRSAKNAPGIWATVATCWTVMTRPMTTPLAFRHSSIIVSGIPSRTPQTLARQPAKRLTLRPRRIWRWVIRVPSARVSVSPGFTCVASVKRVQYASR